MKNEIQIFNNPQFGQVRSVLINNEPWFVLKDVCEILNIENHKDLPKRLDEDEVGRFELPHPQSPQKTVEMLCVNESGLYSVILRSDKPNAKPFRKWVTAEVLPSIRKTGSYSTVKTDKNLEIKDRNSRVRLSNQFLKLAKVDTLSEEYKNILVAKAAEALTGENVLPLPKTEQKMYTATEVGKMFGVSAQKIGRISNEKNMKTEEYGAWYRDKSRYSDREVDNFMYNDKAVNVFKMILS